jgi:diguanylate cyclase (GGDEF)-like protein
LVVEDERVVALDLCSTLQELGYRVSGVATSAVEAHAAASRERPDLVLMDVRLRGDVDGIQSAAAIRAEWNVPVVFLTANANGETLRRALQTSPGGFLSKPYSEQALLSTIEVALSQHDVELALRDENSALQHESSVDALTGLYNRRHLDGVLARELEFAERDQHPVGLILFDLDHFKLVNDQFGHAAGDAVLRDVAQILRSRLRVYDIACRYGGEELVVVVPGTGLFGSRILAEDLRETLAAWAFREGQCELGTVTASFGVAAFPEHADSVVTLLGAADQAMYRAKARGRNRVVAHGQ